MKLYTYYRSSTAYRVRIALAIKNLDWQAIPVHLLQNGGAQFSAEFMAINPNASVPVFIEDDFVLTQSMAILEYLEEQYPHIPILPDNLRARAWVRSLAQIFATDIHPLGNLRVLQKLQKDFGVEEAGKNQWYRDWVERGLMVVEAMLKNSPWRTLDDPCCYGQTPTMADICLVPQWFNAQRFDCALDRFPLSMRIAEYCQTLPAFIQAAPSHQIDAPSIKQ